jgi:hypothetical protein
MRPGVNKKLFDIEVFEDLQDFFFAFGFYQVVERFIVVFDLVPQIDDVLFFLRVGEFFKQFQKLNLLR